MTHQLQTKCSAGGDDAAPPAEFVAASGLAFVVGVSATAYFCRSMSGGMEMPGGWTMSMMWMRMPGQTWFASAISFLLMWLAMMVAMMMPSALPTFLKTRRQRASLCQMASGYFAVWLAAGLGIYALGVALAMVAMESESFSRAIPPLSSASLIAAGAIQFTEWKKTRLAHCRSPFGCASGCPERESGLCLGCRQGVACCVCCTAPLMIQLVLGMMNPWVITAVASVIAAEKLLPRPDIAARLAGVIAILAGVVSFCGILLRPK